MVSVIIPTYNRSDLLLRSLESVFSQSFEEYEVLIVDDGSTDNSEVALNDFLASHPKKSIVRYFKTQNLGVSHARNIGIKNSRFNWLAFLDSDDEWHVDKLEKQIDFSKLNPSIKIIHGNEVWLRNNKEFKQLKKHKKWGGRIFTSCLPLCNISPSTTMIHKDIFDDVGTFNESYTVCEDYELWLRISAKYETGLIESPIIKKHGGHEDQLSHKFKAMDEFRVSALINMRDSDDLNLFEKYLLEEHIVHKSDVLKKGFEKHNNTAQLAKYSKINNEASLIKEKLLQNIYSYL